MGWEFHRGHDLVAMVGIRRLAGVGILVAEEDSRLAAAEDSRLAAAGDSRLAAVVLGHQTSVCSFPSRGNLHRHAC